MHIVRLQALIFAGLALSFFVGGIVVTRTAGLLSERIYEPVLVESASADIAKLRYSDAERTLLQALAATPEYAPTIIQAADATLVVMPELSVRLLETFAQDQSDGTLTELARANILHLHFRLGDFEKVLAMSEQPFADPELRSLSGSLRNQALVGGGFAGGEFGLGVDAERRGAVDEALAHYAAVINSSDSHLQAAEAYLRLSGARSVDNAGATAASAQPSNIGNADR
jgi:tetratricopeptide (TPR) repeat protein